MSVAQLNRMACSRMVWGAVAWAALAGASLACTGLACGQDAPPVDEATQWNILIQSEKYEEARELCTGWLEATEVNRRAEAHKCLANVALSDKGVVKIEPDDRGGGTLSSTFAPEAIDEALGHLNTALELSPQDLSIHQGRLHLLRLSGRYPEMAKALGESDAMYKGSGGFEAWLDYPAELFDEGQLHAGLNLLRVLEKRYPDSHKVVGNIGALLSALELDDEALIYLQRALELAPGDPIDTWNLARLYDYTGKTDLADVWYQKALAADPDEERRKSSYCIYAEFVEKRLKDAKRACKLQEEYCPPDERRACKAWRPADPQP